MLAIPALGQWKQEVCVQGQLGLYSGTFRKKKEKEEGKKVKKKKEGSDESLGSWFCQALSS